MGIIAGSGTNEVKWRIPMDVNGQMKGHVWYCLIFLCVRAMRILQCILITSLHEPYFLVV